MSLQLFFLGFCQALVLLISGVTAIWVRMIRNNLPVPGASTPGIGTLAAEPTPERSGPYTVCTFDYDLSGSFPGRAPIASGYGGRIYVPVLNDDVCSEIAAGNLVELNREFNLVVIAHADGEGPMQDAHLNYEELATHLASNAFIVTSINRYMDQSFDGADAVFPLVLQNHMDYLYNSSPVRNAITNDVALIGHSAGGHSVIRHSDVFNSMEQALRAVVLLAPTMDADDIASFDGIVDAFMGLSVTRDGDPVAFGLKAEDEPMLSNFRIYDEIGITGDPGIITLAKEMVFVNLGVQAFEHYFQNYPFALAYINAFLQQYLNNHKVFERFLKYQERPQSLTSPLPRVWHQHEDTTHLTLANFENGSTTNSTLGGSIDYGSGIDNQMVGQAAVIDPFSPHNTGVLYFETVSGRQNIAFSTGNLDVGAYSWLGLRISQVYHSVNNFPGTDIDFTIRLRDASGVHAGESISDHGGELHFPSPTPTPDNILPGEPEASQQNGQTKNAMRSYLVRLSAFEGIDLTTIQSVEIDFGEEQAGLALIMDDLALYQF